jgi:hypothetical protein
MRVVFEGRSAVDIVMGEVGAVALYGANEVRHAVATGAPPLFLFFLKASHYSHSPGPFEG